MRVLSHDEVVAQLRTLRPKPWPSGMTAAEHDTAVRDFQEALIAAGVNPRLVINANAATLGAGGTDPDLVHLVAATHRKDGATWLAWSTRDTTDKRAVRLQAVPATKEGIEHITSPTFPAKVERERKRLQIAKANVWAALEDSERAALIVLADTPKAEAPTVIAIIRRFSEVLHALDVDSPMPIAVEGLIDASRTPSAEVLRVAQERRKDQRSINQTIREREAHRAKWAAEAERLNHASDHFLGLRPDAVACETREVG